MEHDLIRRLLGVEVVAFAPVVANSVGEDVAGTVEARRADGASNFWVSFQSVFGVLVPEMECSVAACCAEGTVDGVEADGVNGEDIANVAVVGWCLAMALETEVVAGILVVDVLNSTAALYTAHRKASTIAKSTDHTCLPFEGRLNGFEEGGGVLEVDDVDPAFCGANDEHLVTANVHGVDALFGIDCCNGRLLS